MNNMKKTILLASCLIGLGATQTNAQTEVKFHTSMGSFTIELTDALTPITVDSFLARVSDKVYDGLISTVSSITL
jgi:hypothetical protein